MVGVARAWVDIHIFYFLLTFGRETITINSTKYQREMLEKELTKKNDKSNSYDSYDIA